MQELISAVDLRNSSIKARYFVRNYRVAFVVLASVIGLWSLTLQTRSLRATANPSAASPAPPDPQEEPSLWRRAWGFTSFPDRPLSC